MSVGWSVTLGFFGVYGRFLHYRSCLNAWLAYFITAPAHPHATSIAAYPVLFSLEYELQIKSIMGEKNPPKTSNFKVSLLLSSATACTELEIPDNANVFYAVNRSDEAMHFILRRKADQVRRETQWASTDTLSMAMIITEASISPSQSKTVFLHDALTQPKLVAKKN